MADTDVLEVGREPTRHRRGRRWLIPLVALGLLAAAAPSALSWLRHDSDRSALERLEKVWATRVGYDVALLGNFETLDQRATAQDARIAATAAAALEQETADALVRLDHRLDGMRRLLQIRSAVGRALRAEATTLRGAASSADRVGAEILTAAPMLRVDRLLAAARTAQGTQVPHVPTVALHSAERTLDRLSHLVDHPRPVRLLITSDPVGSRVLDLGADSVSPGLALGPGVPLARASAVITSAVGPVTAVPLSGQPPVVLGPAGTAVAPALGPDDVWLTDQRGNVTLVDVRGRRLFGPVRPPGRLLAEVRGGLALSDVGVVWDPRTGQTVRRFGGGCSFAVAAGADLVVWPACFAERHPLDYTNTLHLTTVSTGRDRVVHLKDYREVPEVSASPDSRWLLLFDQQGDHPAPTLVETATGAATRVPSSAGAHGPAVWTPDGTHVFFSTAGSPLAITSTLWMLDTRTAITTAIRYATRGGAIPVAVLP